MWKNSDAGHFCLWGGYRSGSISNIVFLSSEKNAADELAERMNCAALRHVYSEQVGVVEPAQRILRERSITQEDENEGRPQWVK